MVVDDHPIVRRGIVALLEADGGFTVVAEAASAEEALALHRAHRPDVTLMDVGLPGASGIEAIERIRAEAPAARFVVLSTYEGDEDIHRALAAGARAYLLKNMPAAEIKDTIRAVAAGHRRIPPAVAAALEARAPEALSRRELDVLRLIVQGRSNKEIAAALGLGEATVKTHVLNILAKLGVSDRTGAAIAAVKRGIVHL
jgi:two-component system NarL family response regulator